MQELSKLKVAVCHYWLVSFRGGERVVEQILKVFPQADIYTLLNDPAMTREHFPGHKIYSSPFDCSLLRRIYKSLFPLYPLLVRSLKLRQKYDLIISSESGPIKGIQNTDRIPHICYIHSPMRYCHGFTDEYVLSLPIWLRGLARLGLWWLHRWDLTTKDAPGLYIANSQNVRKRVKKYYEKDAKVVCPSVGDHIFEQPLASSAPAGGKPSKPYYIYLGAVTPYKNVGRMIKAFNKNGRELLVVGEGSGLKRLKAMAGDNISFVGQVTEERKISLLKGASALIFPPEEDFGIVPLEAMALGVPVVALERGGALETVVYEPDAPSQSTGIFFQQKDCSDLTAAVEQLEARRRDYSPEFIRNHARKFSDENFRSRFSDAVSQFLRGNSQI